MTLRLRPLAFGLLLGGAALAQPATPDLLSRLTEAERALLLSAVGIASADAFLPGRVAPDLPFAPPALPGQSVVGSVMQPGGALVVVRTTATPEAARVAALKVLALGGWRDQYDLTGSGDVFQSSFGDGFAVQTVMSQCKPGVPGSLAVTASPAPGGSQVTYRYLSFTGISSTCPANLEWNDPAQRNFYAPGRNAPARDPLAELRAGGLVLPTLSAPAGARVSQGGSWSSTDGPTGPFYAAYATVRTAQDAQAVLAHYVAALRAQGWTPGQAQRGADGEWTVTLTARQGGQERRGSLALMPRPELVTTEGGVRLNRLDVRFTVGEVPEF
ncbi:hypothetical protein RDMS_05225 [Deinococcus sp. RL]|uniref:hypothetical protein n=1 Tax=Deinococcus sp. RL TaxID=1489678 RepID=UPI0004D47E18|nr:hypothetical protein [Deinococcus sp. RL]KEF34827.1 hypothetical protein RDMS_05225 [Deinococcus sp. RL]